VFAYRAVLCLPRTIAGDCKIAPVPPPAWIARRRLLALRDTTTLAAEEAEGLNGIAARAEVALQEFERGDGMTRSQRLRLLSDNLGTTDVKTVSQFVFVYGARVSRALTLFYAALGNSTFFTTPFDRPELLPAWRAATADTSPLGAGITADELATIRAAFDSSTGVFPWEPVHRMLQRWNNTLIAHALVDGVPAGAADASNLVPLMRNASAAALNASGGALVDLAADYTATIQESVAEGFADSFEAMGAALAAAHTVIDNPTPGICATVRVQLTQVCRGHARPLVCLVMLVTPSALRRSR
jgi:hypothetical protein